MATIMIPERLNGKYDGTTPTTLLPPGGIGGGKSIRKVSQSGGWQPRKGCALHNTTALETGSAVKSLHYYKNPFSADAHFVAQCNSKLLTESAQNKLPPTQDTSYGTTLGVSVGTTPGFSTQVGEWWFYADGSSRPIVWGGTSPRIKGFLVTIDSYVTFSDYSRKVTDGRTDTYGLFPNTAVATTNVSIYSEERLSGVTLTLGNANATASVLTVKAMRSGVLTAVNALSDGTSVGGATLAQSGTISWTASALDETSSLHGIQGYRYDFTWSVALSVNVQVQHITCTQAAQVMTNKWNGEWNYVSGCKFFDASLGQYIDVLGKISNESTSMYIDLSEATTSDYLYIKTPEAATMFGLGVVDGYGNVSASLVDLIEYWTGSAWATMGGIVDTTKDSGGTKSFAQTGALHVAATQYTPHMYKLTRNETPGYWYRLSWAAALSTNVRIYTVFYASLPETLPSYVGCVEFKNRLFLWGDPEYPNRLRYSAREDPFCFSGYDSGYTDAFGAKDLVLCAIKYYNELVVFKANSVWLLEGEDSATFGILKITEKVGLASPKSVQVAEVGFPAMHREEPMTIAIWEDVDGVYVFDGRKTKKESGAIDHYFNPKESQCIAAANIITLQSFNDPINNEYHLLLPAGELVYNYVTAEWYPPWEREIDLTCGVDFTGSDNRKYCYGGSSSGFVMYLETDTSDKSTANADVAIEHSLKTRALSYEKGERAIVFGLRRILAEFKARSAGSIVTKTYKDQASSGTTQAIPQAMTLVKSGYNIIIPHIEVSIEDCRCIELEFSSNTIDQEMEIYSFSYELGGKGISES